VIGAGKPRRQTTAVVRASRADHEAGRWRRFGQVVSKGNGLTQLSQYTARGEEPMTDKFRRDERNRGDRQLGGYRNREDDRYMEDRYGEERWLRSPEREFESSQPYRQPRDENWNRWARSPLTDYDAYRGRADYDARSERSYGRSNIERQGYAPSPYVPEPSRGGFSGRGPKGYSRTDERIREDVCDRLSWNDEVDATDITVRVESGVVTLQGSVETRHMKRLAIDLAENVPGVQDVDSSIRVTKPMLTELKEKITGEQSEHHYANTGTRSSSDTASSSRNGSI
jgi:hypothetical protein